VSRVLIQVTPEHLKIAQGNVRCGQCRNVFSALGNLTEQPPASAYQTPAGVAGKNGDEDIIEEEVVVKKARPKPAIKKAKASVKQNARTKAVNNLKKNSAIAKPQAKPPVKPKSKPKAKATKPKTAPAPVAVKPSTVKAKTKTSENFKQKVAPKEVTKPATTENKEENKSRLGQAIAAIKALNKTAPNTLNSLEAGRDSYIGKIKDNIEKIEQNIKKEVRKRVDLQYKKPPAKKTTPKKVAKQTDKANTVPPQVKLNPKPSVPPVAVAPTKTEPTKKANFFDPQEAVDLDQVFQDIDNLDIDNLDIDNNTPIINFDAPGANVNTVSTDIQNKTDIKIKSLSRNIPDNNLVSQNHFAQTEATQGKSLAIIPKQLINDFKVIVEKNQPEPPNTLNTIWHVGSVALMIVFLIQTIYFKHNDLAKIPPLRPWIESFCNHLACDLSLPSDVRKLELLGQDIRSHPKQKKALLVSTTIINNSRFTQSYPILEITFSNMNGQKVAMRRFLAAEYLPAKIEIDKGMLPNTPIKIELGMLDPGADAVNFEFDFLPN